MSSKSSIHQRVPITVQGRTLRIEHAANCPYSLSSGFSGNALELRKSLDPVTCSAILKELTRCPRYCKNSHKCSELVGCLRISLANFWSRLGYVEVRILRDRNPAANRSLTYESISLNGSSLQVQKRHYAQCVRVRHTDSATI
jgi:hypothetical protein